MAQSRLDKLIAQSGAYSRSEARALIRAGRVTVDGSAAVSADEKADDRAVIAVDGRAIATAEHLYLMLHKPPGCVSSTDDPRDQTVLELLEPALARRGLFSAGRLDKDAEGLLLLTNDGDFCHRIISPKKRVPKTYYIEVSGTFCPEDARRVADGLVLGDGTVCRPGTLCPLGDGDRALITIHEGKYHQVKRMASALGKPVTRLKRLSIGALNLDETLAPGEYRRLTPEEVRLALEGGAAV